MLWWEFKHDLPTADEMKCIKTTTRLGGDSDSWWTERYQDHGSDSWWTEKTAGHIAEWDFNETVEDFQEHYLQGINDPLSRDTPNLRNTLLFATLIFTYKKAKD